MRDEPRFKDAIDAIHYLYNRGVEAESATKIIIVPTQSHIRPGIKVWGAIDYLCNNHKFTWRNAV